MKGGITEKDIKHENPRQTMQHGKSWYYKDRKKAEKVRSRTGQDKTGRCRTGYKMDNKGDDRSGWIGRKGKDGTGQSSREQKRRGLDKNLKLIN